MDSMTEKIVVQIRLLSTMGDGKRRYNLRRCYKAAMAFVGEVRVATEVGGLWRGDGVGTIP